MSTVISKPGPLSFTGTMENLVLKSPSAQVRVSIKVTSAYGTHEVLNEVYYPDESGSVTIYHPGDLCEPYARQYGSVTATASVYDITDSGVQSAALDVDLGTVLFGNVDPQIDAATFCQRHFLNILMGTKVTAMGRKESLSAYDAGDLTVSACFVTADGSLKEMSGTLSPVNTTGKVQDYDVSPSKILAAVNADDGASLVGYVCKSGERKQPYELVVDKVPPAPSLAFLNSFGCWEYIHCTGTHKKSSKFTYSTAVVGDKTRNYAIQEQRQLTANTGSLNYAMAEWADELFRSQQVYLYTGGKMGKEVVVSDVKDEVTNEDDNMPSYEFTWMYAQKLHNVIDTETKRLRVFDGTFDYTFE